MTTLNATKRAPILAENGQTLNTGYAVSSSDPAICRVVNDYPRWFAIGVSGGTATLTATRNVDNAVATLDVTVIAAVPFTISLGAEEPA